MDLLPEQAFGLRLWLTGPVDLQGYLAHKKPPTPLGPPDDPSEMLL